MKAHAAIGSTPCGRPCLPAYPARSRLVRSSPPRPVLRQSSGDEPSSSAQPSSSKPSSPTASAMSVNSHPARRGRATPRGGSDFKNERGSWPCLNVTRNQKVGAGGAFVSGRLRSEGRAMLVLKSDDTTWNGTIVEGKADDTIFQAYRIMRCGRSMLLEHEGMVPVIQPTVLQYDLDGAKANSTVFFLSKVLYGRLDVREVLKVASSTTAESLSGAIQREVKKNGACVLESFGKMAAVTSLKAVLQARRDLTALGVDIAMVLDPVVVEVDAEYEATTLMNRFVLMECEVNKPALLKVKVDHQLDFRL